MKRRDVLKRTSVLAGIGAIAGCTGGAESPGGESGGDDGSDGDGGDDGSDGDGSDPTAEPTETETDSGATAITGQSIETIDRSCMSGSQSATVEWEAEAVVLTGTLEASDPCHDATFESLDFDAEAGELTAAVGLTAQDVDACQSCIGGIEFEGRIAFDGPAPSSVTVVGTSMGEETTLAEESK